jgi:hypothetical protein
MKNLEEKLKDYGDVLEDQSGRYVLIQSVRRSQDYETCMVYDLETKTGLLEETTTYLGSLRSD